VIRVELVKMLRRPRTWASVALLCVLPTIVAIFVSVRNIGPRPGEGPAFLSAVLNNGALYPAAALAIVLPIFLPVSVALMAGEAIAGEANAGTLRYLLIRPVSRSRLLVAKLVSIVVFVLGAVVIVALESLVVGVSLLGNERGSVISVSGANLTPSQVATRMVLAVGFIGISMVGVAAIALFLSTLTDSPAGAALGALATLVGSQILVTLEASSPVAPYLPTRYWLAWIDLFRDPILWREIERGVALQAVYAGVFLALAWANLSSKDIAD
jgi:ABC-2 type transport system permease protein